MLAPGRIQETLRADVGAEVYNLEAVNLEHQRHHVLADVVDIALGRADHHRAGRATGSAGFQDGRFEHLQLHRLDDQAGAHEVGQEDVQSGKRIPDVFQYRLDHIAEQFDRRDAIGERGLRQGNAGAFVGIVNGSPKLCLHVLALCFGQTHVLPPESCWLSRAESGSGANVILRVAMMPGGHHGHAQGDVQRIITFGISAFGYSPLTNILHSSTAPAASSE